jgi:hypothetical protein
MKQNITEGKNAKLSETIRNDTKRNEYEKFEAREEIIIKKPTATHFAPHFISFPISIILHLIFLPFYSLHI